MGVQFANDVGQRFCYMNLFAPKLSLFEIDYAAGFNQF